MNKEEIESEILDLRLHIAAMEFARQECLLRKTADALEEEIINFNNQLKELERECQSSS